MNNRTEINKYSFWVKEIDRYPEFLDELKPSVYELKKCLDYISGWKHRYFVDDLNPTLLLNPTMTKEEAKSEDYKQLERVEVIIKDCLKQGKTELDQVECDVKHCSPTNCSRPELKNRFYDFQIEEFEKQKTYLSTEDLKTYILERKKHYLNEVQKISVNKGKNLNANCLHNQMRWLLDFFNNQTEPGKPRVDPEQYYKSSGIYDGLKEAGKTLRFTHSLVAMKGQQNEIWEDYLQKYKSDAKKYGNTVEEANISIARKQFLEKEVYLYTGYLTMNQSANDKVEIQKYLTELEDEISHAAPEKQKPGAKSFSWTGSQAQLEDLWQALKDAGYIDREKTKEAFMAIFASKLIKDRPIQWLGSNRLLSYLFNQMSSGKNSLILSLEWQSIIEKYQLFKNKNGKLITAGDLSAALSNINDVNKGLNPKGFEKIDAILNNIKTLRP